MKTLTLLMTAILLLSTAAGQQTIQPQNHEAIEEARLEQAHQKLLGSRFCGDHFVTASTFFEGVARNQNGSEEAFAVRWLDRTRGSAVVHSAIFTTRRCIASDLDLADDGKILVQVLGDSLTASEGGHVAYEAYFVNRQDEAHARSLWHLAAFVERGFAFELDRSKMHFDMGVRTDSAPDFFLSPDGRIIPRIEFVFGQAGVAEPSPAPQAGRPHFAITLPAFPKPAVGLSAQGTPQAPVHNPPQSGAKPSPKPAAQAPAKKPASPSVPCVPMPFRSCPAAKH